MRAERVPYDRIGSHPYEPTRGYPFVGQYLILNSYNGPQLAPSPLRCPYCAAAMVLSVVPRAYQARVVALGDVLGAQQVVFLQDIPPGVHLHYCPDCAQTFSVAPEATECGFVHTTD